MAFFGQFCSFAPFRGKRRLFGSTATKALVRPPSAMVLEVFESARRPKCHATASLRHVRRLKSVHTPQKSAPECPWGDEKAGSIAFRERGFSGRGTPPRSWSPSPSDEIARKGKTRGAGTFPPKNSRFGTQKNTNRPLESNQRPPRQPQAITPGDDTTVLTIALKYPHFPPPP